MDDVLIVSWDTTVKMINNCKDVNSEESFSNSIQLPGCCFCIFKINYSFIAAERKKHIMLQLLNETAK